MRSNRVKMDTEWAMESVLINGVFVESGLNSVVSESIHISISPPPPPPPPPRKATEIQRGGGVQKDAMSEGLGGSGFSRFFPCLQVRLVSNPKLTGALLSKLSGILLLTIF